MPIKKAFTLIELLIVVAIIAILAAIAVPNFLEAQTRARVSRVKADFRTLATAMGAYQVDNNIYPINTWHTVKHDLIFLTTPVSFMTTVTFDDPFKPDKQTDGSWATTDHSYLYANLANSKDPKTYPNWIDLIGDYKKYGTAAYALISWGPDRTHTGAEWYYPMMRNGTDKAGALGTIYDPTNGTVSRGDILRLEGDTRGVTHQN